MRLLPKQIKIVMPKVFESNPTHLHVFPKTSTYSTSGIKIVALILHQENKHSVKNLNFNYLRIALGGQPNSSEKERVK